MRLGAKSAAALKAAFLDLLDEGSDEQIYQEYLESNPQLIPRVFLLNHGLHFDVVLRKVPLARQRTTDFLYLTKSSAHWHCVLVEIEKPTSRYFKDNSNRLHADFEGALHQIREWKAWCESDGNTSHLVNEVLGPLLMPLGMRRNPVTMKFVLVHGRRSEVLGNETRERLVRQSKTPDFEIMSFDSLAEDLLNRSDAYIGSCRSEYIRILSSRFVSASLFTYANPTQFEITQALKEAILSRRKDWAFAFSDPKAEKPLVELAMERIRIY